MKPVHAGMTDRARALRREATPEEQSFWAAVRGGRFAGFKFRRQKVIGPYIVDFICLQAGLIVELDGGHHAEQVAYDQARDDWLSAQGYRVMRIPNAQWTQQPATVLEQLWQSLNSPLPTGERGWG